MKRDWVVWVGCFLLFAAGAVFSKLSLGSNFFLVPSVHDLFDIASSMATVIAVIFAGLGLSSWRKQLRATSDYELARKMLVAVQKYADAAEESWRWCYIANDEQATDAREGKERTIRAIAAGAEPAMRKTRQYTADLKALLLECRALWADYESLNLRDFLKFGENCDNYLSSFIEISAVESKDEYLINVLRGAAMQSIWDGLKGVGLTEQGAVSGYISRELSYINGRLGEKFIR
ncbi:hypothetical protein [Pseudomonas aeruginosa]|uniref:hypothetical protein n=1 Tax=Pseudomonas aeruginosa TaxID=287 RepID=UPI0010110754|nr:hypothetical protein [Pseudomonas aeruginosa]